MPHVKPPPKPDRESSGYHLKRIMPFSTHSESKIGILAALVFPYSSYWQEACVGLHRSSSHLIQNTDICLMKQEIIQFRCCNWTIFNGFFDRPSNITICKIKKLLVHPSSKKQELLLDLKGEAKAV